MTKNNYNNFNKSWDKLSPKKYLFIHIINKLFGEKLLFSSFILKYYNILKLNLKPNQSIYYNYFLINLSHLFIFLPINFQIKIKLWIYIIYYKYIIYIHNYLYNGYLNKHIILKKFPLINLVLKFININRINKLDQLKINKYSKNYIFNNLIIYDANKTLYNNFQSLVLGKKLLFINIKYIKYLILINNNFLKYYYFTFNKYFNIKYLLKTYNTAVLLNYNYINDISSKLYITNLQTFYIQLKLYYYNINYFIFNIKLQKNVNIVNLKKNNCIFYQNTNNKSKIIKVFIWYQIKTLIILSYFRKMFYKITKINNFKEKSIKNLYLILKFYNLMFCPLNLNLIQNYLDYLKLNNLILNNLIKSINTINIIKNILVDKLINSNYKIISYYLKNIFLLYNKNIFLNSKKLLIITKKPNLIDKINSYNLLLNNKIIFKNIYLLNNNKYIWFFENNFLINIFIKLVSYTYIFIVNHFINKKLN